MNIYIYIHTHIYIYICICMHRDIDIDIDRERERERAVVLMGEPLARAHLRGHTYNRLTKGAWSSSHWNQKPGPNRQGSPGSTQGEPLV